MNFSRPVVQVNGVRKSRSVDTARRDRKVSLRPVVKKLAPSTEGDGEGDSSVDENDHNKEKVEERLFNPIGYEPHLVEILEKDILQRNPNIPWNKVAGLQEAKTILQEAMVLPMLMPDYFKVINQFYICKETYLFELSHLKLYLKISACYYKLTDQKQHLI